MKNIWVITKYTIREALSKKIILTFFGVSTFMLLVFSIIFGSQSIQDLMPLVKINGQQLDDSFPILDKIIDFFKIATIVPIFGVGIFLSIFSVSSIIPNLVEKGNIDLFLSKPISRTQLILGKFNGGVLVVLANIAYAVGGFWILLGIKFGYWDPKFLMTIFTITFTFSVLYSLIILVGILTRSSILAMMISYLIFFIFSPLLLAREGLYLLSDSKFYQYFIDGIYYIVPKTAELANITRLFAQGEPITSWQPVLTSAAFMILTLIWSIFTFNKKDY